MEFKRLSDVEVVVEPTESANVLIEENGVIKKAPKTTVGGANNGGFIVIDMPMMEPTDADAGDLIPGMTCNKTFDEVVEMYCNDEIILAMLRMSPGGFVEIHYCIGMGLIDVSGNIASNAGETECVAFEFNGAPPICYYRNGFSITIPGDSGPQ